MTESVLRLRVNGSEREFRSGASVADLLHALGVKSQRVAVERNREIVPRAAHATVILQDDDELEIVHFVGGG